MYFSKDISVGWIWGHVKQTGKQGLFPLNHVRRLI